MVTVIDSEAQVKVATTSWFVAPVVEYTIEAVGAVVSIQFTVAVVEPVFPASSTKSKTNDPLALKVYVFDPELFVMVMFSLAPVRVATTAPLVVTDGEYVTVAVGETLSILDTVAVADPVFHAASTKSKVNDPLEVKV